MDSICFIAARGGSKGVPHKNIRKLAGKPLIAYTIESALDSKLFKHVIVSTEDKQIARIAKKFGAEIPFMRPKNLATNNSSMDDVTLHAIKKLKLMGFQFDVIVNRDCTVPFIRNKDIKGSIKLLQEKNPDIVCGVYKQHLNPYYNMMEIDKHGNLECCKKLTKKLKRRQDAPIIYQLNGLFTFYVENFLKYRTYDMPRVIPYEIPLETGLMIDTEFEFQIADMIAQKKIKI